MAQPSILHRSLDPFTPAPPSSLTSSQKQESGKTISSSNHAYNSNNNNNNNNSNSNNNNNNNNAESPFRAPTLFTPAAFRATYEQPVAFKPWVPTGFGESSEKLHNMAVYDAAKERLLAAQERLRESEERLRAADKLLSEVGVRKRNLHEEAQRAAEHRAFADEVRTKLEGRSAEASRDHLGAGAAVHELQQELNLLLENAAALGDAKARFNDSLQDFDRDLDEETMRNTLHELHRIVIDAVARADGLRKEIEQQGLATATSKIQVNLYLEHVRDHYTRKADEIFAKTEMSREDLGRVKGAISNAVKKRHLATEDWSGVTQEVPESNIIVYDLLHAERRIIKDIFELQMRRYHYKGIAAPLATFAAAQSIIDQQMKSCEALLVMARSKEEEARVSGR